MLENIAEKLYAKVRNKIGTIALVSGITLATGVLGMAYTTMVDNPKPDNSIENDLRIKKIKIEHQLSTEYALKDIKYEQLIAQDSLIKILKEIETDKKYLIAENASKERLFEYQTKLIAYTSVAIISVLVFGASGSLMIEYANKK